MDLGENNTRLWMCATSQTLDAPLPRLLGRPLSKRPMPYVRSVTGAPKDRDGTHCLLVNSARTHHQRADVS